MSVIRDQAHSMLTAGITGLAIAVILGMQISMDLLASDSYAGLRISLSDSIVPLAGLWVLATLMAGKSAWPRWRLKYCELWLGAMTLVLLAAAGHFYHDYGHVSFWAMKKIIGWLAMLAYFMLGAWLVTNCDVKHFYRRILQFLPASHMIVFFIILGLTLINQSHSSLRFTHNALSLPIEGLLANHNNYAFFTLCVYALALPVFVRQPHIMPKWFWWLFWTFLPVFAILNGSRAGWITLAMLIIAGVALFGIHRLRKIGIMLGLGTVCALGVLSAAPGSHDKFEKRLDHSQNLMTAPDKPERQDKLKTGDRLRIAQYRDAIRLYSQVPVSGIGLGRFIAFQKDKYAHIQDEQLRKKRYIKGIHSTPLWLLTETGLPGFAIFAGFFIAVFTKLAKYGFQEKDIQASLCLGGMMMLIAFAGMSLFHELTYSRYLWFLAGISLGRPLDASCHPQRADQTDRPTGREDQDR